MTLVTSKWDPGKHDVLIKGMQRVVITLKSDYRPSQPQYPLKKAVEDITSVLNVLSKAGVIVPCENSLVCTSILPVKKIRDEGVNDVLYKSCKV